MQHTVGKISKQWGGLAQEWFTKADNFGVNFPVDLDVKVKASLLGALFLIVSLPHRCAHSAPITMCTTLNFFSVSNHSHHNNFAHRTISSC